MKKAISLIAIILASAVLSAAVIPVRDTTDRTYFDSPARLAEIEEKSPFGIQVKGYADMDMLNFIYKADTTLAVVADRIRMNLLDKSDEDLYAYYDQIHTMFEFDPQFPDKTEDQAETVYFLRYYLNERFFEIGDGNMAKAAINGINSGIDGYSSDMFSGELDLTLRMYGGEIRNGFGWQYDIGIILDGSPLFNDVTCGDYTYGNDLYFIAGADFGYGAFVGDRFAAGISISPDFMFRSVASGDAFVNAVMNADILELLGNNNFDFGLSLEMNLGFMFKANDELRLLLDIRNLPSFQTYWYFTAMDLEDFRFHYDENIYFISPDVSFGLLWDKGPFHIEFELSNIADQMIWKAMIPSYAFDIFSIPKLKFSYDILTNLSVSLGYEYRYVLIGVDWEGLAFEFRCMVDRLGFGFALGYGF